METTEILQQLRAAIASEQQRAQCLCVAALALCDTAIDTVFRSIYLREIARRERAISRFLRQERARPAEP